MGVNNCYSKGSDNRCLECKEGYGLFGEHDTNGYSKCVKCAKNCNYCFENKCIQCKCGYIINTYNPFECIKENVNSNNNLGDYEVCEDANNFISVNIILLSLIIILIFKLH